ncbi:MAG: hypothetical protein M9894_35445 [Planctomycetes bacterium]|nr:hypothetical protein [Planctomycetota bacterium]
MPLDHCSAHGVKATGKCYSCHKPTCPQCRPRDNTCSDRCFQSKQRFVATHVPPRPPRPYLSIFTLAALAAAAYGVARYLGYIPG